MCITLWRDGWGWNISVRFVFKEHKIAQFINNYQFLKNLQYHSFYSKARATLRRQICSGTFWVFSKVHWASISLFVQRFLKDEQAGADLVKARVQYGWIWVKYVEFQIQDFLEKVQNCYLSSDLSHLFKSLRSSSMRSSFIEVVIHLFKICLNSTSVDPQMLASILCSFPERSKRGQICITRYMNGPLRLTQPSKD